MPSCPMAATAAILPLVVTAVDRLPTQQDRCVVAVRTTEVTSKQRTDTNVLSLRYVSVIRSVQKEPIVDYLSPVAGTSLPGSGRQQQRPSRIRKVERAKSTEEAIS